MLKAYFWHFFVYLFVKLQLCAIFILNLNFEGIFFIQFH